MKPKRRRMKQAAKLVMARCLIDEVCRNATELRDDATLLRMRIDQVIAALNTEKP